MIEKLKQQNYFLIELLMAFRLVAIITPAMFGGILVQDKICYITHQQSATFCQNIEKPTDSAQQQHMKEQILAESAQFGNYKYFVETVPLVGWCLFLGPFLDNYKSASYIIILVSIIGDICFDLINLALIYFYETNPYYQLLPSLTIWLTGGLNSFTTTVGLYITSTTKEESRAVKFAFIEIASFSAIAVATFAGGQLMWVKDDAIPPLRTYHYCYLFAILLNAVCLVFLLFLFIVDKNKMKNIPKHTENSKNRRLDQSTDIEPKQNIVRILFNLDNVRQTIHCFFKRRPSNVRMQIFLLCFIQYGQLLITNGLSGLMVQFAQKLYHWSPNEYSLYTVIKQIADVVMISVCSTILVVKFRLQDSTLICLAQISNFFADLVRGTFLSPFAFFISIPIGGLSWFGIISGKTKFSRIIPKEDVGKILSLNAVVESIVPLAASLIYSNLFALSVSTYPGLIYHFSCLLMIFTVAILTIEHIYCPVKSHEEEEEAKQQQKL